MNRISRIVFIIAAVFSVGCSAPPTEAMNNAIAAVNKMESDANVINYAADTLSRAREVLSQMQSEADAKRYTEAARLADDVMTLVGEAVTSSRDAAARAQSEAAAAAAKEVSDADNSIRVMQSAISEMEDTLNKARRARPKGVNINQLDADFSKARLLADEAVAAQTAGRYREAIEISRNVRTALSAITASLSQSARAASRKK